MPKYDTLISHCRNLRLADCLHCRHLHLANEILIAFSTAGRSRRQWSFHWMVQGKRLQSLRQNRNLFPLDERSTGADTLFGAAAGVERNA